MSLRKNYSFHLVKQQDHMIEFALDCSETYCRVMVLEENLFRVVISPQPQLTMKKTWQIAPGQSDIPFEGRDRLCLKDYTCPDYSCTVTDTHCIIETAVLRAEINLDGFRIAWFCSQNHFKQPFAQDRQTQAYNFDQALGHETFHYMIRHPEDQYYGLGEKTGELNRHGNRYRMVSVDPMGYDPQRTDPLYKMLPFYITIPANQSFNYGLCYDTTHHSVFDFGKEYDNYHGRYRYFQTGTTELDYYLFVNPTIMDTVKQVAWLTGQTCFQPKWSFGYSGSTMTYTDLDRSQERLMEFIQHCKQHDILCDSFQLSSGYTSIENKRYVFTWNKDKFPNPKQFTEDFHQSGLKLCANIKPCMLQDHPFFKQLEEKKLFIVDKDGQKPEMTMFWDDIGAYLDFTNTETIQWWKKIVKEQLLDLGIDSTWNDNNEFEIWSESAWCAGFGEKVAFEEVRAILPLLMMKASFEAQKEAMPQLRPYVISRSGCYGMQRYAQTWTGDNMTSWDSLKYNIKTGIGLSLSGIYNFGHDVGGFSGNAPEPELLIRWVQNGIFHPRFTIHSWNDDQTVNVPWMYKETTSIIQQLITFRYRLIPYLYSELYQAHTNYMPMIRPTFLNYESDPNTFQPNDDFMLGDALLICSVVEPGQDKRTVYLPENQGGWYAYHSKEWYDGGQNISIDSPLEQINFMVQAGGIIPMNSAELSFETKQNDCRTIEIYAFPGVGTKQYVLYEDDGVCADFQQHHTLLTITLNCTEHQVSIEHHLDQKGSHTLAYQKMVYQVYGRGEREICVQGKTVLLENNQISCTIA